MICQDCQKEPAIYGDGITWGRCAKCQYEYNKKHNVQDKKEPDPAGQGMPHKMVPGLTSIILPVYMNNYPLFHYTGNCIGSIREYTNQDDYELIVIDNGSPIKPPNLNSYYADKVIQNEANLGVTKAWNQGIRASFGEYIVLINNDVQVYDSWLPTMKACLNEGGLDLVMATPMYSNTEPFARSLESDQHFMRYSGKYVKDSFSEFRDFSCVMFKKSLLEEIGVFDEDFFAYCSDSDFIKRMELAGKKWASTKMVATHHVSDATGASIEQTPEIMNKDKAIYAEKWDKVEIEDYSGSNEGALGKAGDTATGAQIETEKPNFIRSNETGDRIYFVKDGKIYPISNPETYKAVGGDFGKEVTITKEEFSKFERGPLLTMGNYKEYA